VRRKFSSSTDNDQPIDLDIDDVAGVRETAPTCPECTYNRDLPHARRTDVPWRSCAMFVAPDAKLTSKLTSAVIRVSAPLSTAGGARSKKKRPNRSDVAMKYGSSGDVTANRTFCRRTLEWRLTCAVCRTV